MSNSFFIHFFLGIQFCLILVLFVTAQPEPNLDPNQSNGLDFSQLKSCTDHNECNNFNEVCFQGKCLCKFGFDLSLNSKSCQQLNCTSNWACEARFINSQCNILQNKCECKPYHSMLPWEGSLFCYSNPIWFIPTYYVFEIIFAYIIIIMCTLVFRLYIKQEQIICLNEKMKKFTNLEKTNHEQSQDNVPISMPQFEQANILYQSEMEQNSSIYPKHNLVLSSNDWHIQITRRSSRLPKIVTTEREIKIRIPRYPN